RLALPPRQRDLQGDDAGSCGCGTRSHGQMSSSGVRQGQTHPLTWVSGPTDADQKHASSGILRQDKSRAAGRMQGRAVPGPLIVWGERERQFRAVKPDAPLDDPACKADDAQETAGAIKDHPCPGWKAAEQVTSPIDFAALQCVDELEGDAVDCPGV